MWRGEKFTLRTYHYDDVENDNNRFVIWGLTARILWLVAKIVYDNVEHNLLPMS
jgi:hypothetical protein